MRAFYDHKGGWIGGGGHYELYGTNCVPVDWCSGVLSVPQDQVDAVAHGWSANVARQLDMASLYRRDNDRIPFAF